MHIQEKYENALQVLFASLSLRKLGLSFVSMHQSQRIVLLSEKNLSYLDFFYDTDFDRCVVDEKAILIPGDKSMLD